MEAGQENLIGENESQEQTKESETYPFLLLGSSQKHHANIHSIYTKNLVQTHDGSGFVFQSLYV